VFGLMAMAIAALDIQHLEQGRRLRRTAPGGNIQKCSGKGDGCSGVYRRSAGGFSQAAGGPRAGADPA
jgi:hypothetical protein